MPYIYNRKWRDADEKDAPKDIKPVIRFKSKIEGNSKLKDLVQGDVEIENNTIEDFIILRKKFIVFKNFFSLSIFLFTLKFAYCPKACTPLSVLPAPLILI